MMPAGTQLRAVLASSVHSAQGREEYVRVKLEAGQQLPHARPVFGKSGVLSTLVKADGFVVVPIHAEGLPAGQQVDVFLF